MLLCTRMSHSHDVTGCDSAKMWQFNEISYQFHTYNYFTPGTRNAYSECRKDVNYLLLTQCCPVSPLSIENDIMVPDFCSDGMVRGMRSLDLMHKCVNLPALSLACKKRVEQQYVNHPHHPTLSLPHSWIEYCGFFIFLPEVKPLSN